MYKLKKIVGTYDLSAQFYSKIIYLYKKIGYNINVLWQTACLVVNTITVDHFTFLFKEDKLSKATSSFFFIKMIAKLEWT